MSVLLGVSIKQALRKSVKGKLFIDIKVERSND